MKKLLSLVTVVSFLCAHAEQDQSLLKGEARLGAATTCFYGLMSFGLYLTALDYVYFNKINGVRTTNKVLRFMRNNGPRALKIASLLAFPFLVYLDAKAKLEMTAEENARMKELYQNEVREKLKLKAENKVLKTLPEEASLNSALEDIQKEDAKGSWFPWLHDIYR